MGVLRTTLQALQHHGERLSRGWPPIFRLVSAVGRTCDDPATVAAGFTCVECICSDLLSSLPKDHIPTALDLILDYGARRLGLAGVVLGMGGEGDVGGGGWGELLGVVLVAGLRLGLVVRKRAALAASWACCTGARRAPGGLAAAGSSALERQR
jgi:hypothetical protein